MGKIFFFNVFIIVLYLEVEFGIFFIIKYISNYI